MLTVPLYFLLTRPRRTLAALALAGIAIAFLYAYDVDLLNNRLSKHLLRPENLVTGSSRIVLWRTGLQIFQHRPLAGHGWGNSDMLLSEYDETLVMMQVNVGYFHNSTLDVLLNVGLIGGTLYALLVGIPLVQGARAWLACTSPQHRELLLSLTLGWAAILLVFEFESGMLSFGSAWALPSWVVGVALHRASWLVLSAPARASLPVRPTPPMPFRVAPAGA